MSDKVNLSSDSKPDFQAKTFWACFELFKYVLLTDLIKLFIKHEYKLSLRYKYKAWSWDKHDLYLDSMI